MKRTNIRKKKLNTREHILYDLVCMQLKKAKVIYSVTYQDGPLRRKK